MSDYGTQAIANFHVLVEFADWVTHDDIVTDLAQSSLHRFHDYQPNVAHSREGRTELRFTVGAPDLWTSALTAMAIVRQSGYEPSAVHVAAPLEPTRVA
jgi:hypothetical protein